MSIPDDQKHLLPHVIVDQSASELARLELDRRRLREEQERAAKTVAPAPVLPPGAPDPRFPRQQVVVLNPPERRYGDVPVETVVSEADRMKDPAALLQRINALEAKVAKLEGTMNRYFGGSISGEGQVYR